MDATKIIISTYTRTLFPRGRRGESYRGYQEKITDRGGGGGGSQPGSAHIGSCAVELPFARRAEERARCAWRHLTGRAGEFATGPWRTGRCARRKEKSTEM